MLKCVVERWNGCRSEEMRRNRETGWNRETEWNGGTVERGKSAAVRVLKRAPAVPPFHFAGAPFHRR